MLEVLSQLFKFMKVHKKFWIAPAMLILICLGGLLVAAQSSAIAPFIYVIF